MWYSGRDGLTRRIGETASGYNSQSVSVGRRGGDSPLTRAPALCQNIKCSGRGSGCRRGGPARASSETESNPRGRPALERGGVPPEGGPALERGGVPAVRRCAPRAKRSFARGVSGLTVWWVAEVARAVGSCHRAVIVLGVIYDL
jgi:hypothetical protein